MPEGYKIYQSNNLIKKVVKNELNIENFRNIIQELAAASAIYQDHNLLIDIRDIKPHKNFSEVLKILSEAVKYKHAFHNRIAVIIADEPERIARSKFFKAGLPQSNYRFKFFTEYEKAIDWLSDIQTSSSVNQITP